MKVVQIASGSKGNATYIESGNNKIIIDIGISKKRILESLSNDDLTIIGLDGILITHEHTDHTAGLVPLYNATHAKIYTTKGTYKGLSNQIKAKIPKEAFTFIKNDEMFFIGEINIEAIPIFHDANDPVGFVVKNNTAKLVYVTDTGYIKQSYFEQLSNANMYIWESNHDPEILMESDRPYDTKLRILSDIGHMSNQDSAYVLANIIGPNTKNIVFAHISEECNLNQIIKLTSSRVFNDLGVDTSYINFYYASQVPLEEFDL